MLICKKMFIAIFVMSCGILSADNLLNRNIKNSWEAAAKGDIQATAKLSALYLVTGNIKEKQIEQYIQSAADEMEGGEQTIYDGDFIIIAKEASIISFAARKIKKDSENIKKEIANTFMDSFLISDGVKPLLFWPKIWYKVLKGEIHNYCAENISTLQKILVISTEKGKFTSRKKYIDENIKDIAVVDRETALQYFDFVDIPNKDWTVYVRCPFNKNLLIPFNMFHHYVYEHKMRSFIALCSNLGARKAKIFYMHKNSDNSTQEYRISGDFSNLAGVKTALKNFEEKKHLFDIGYDVEFSGSSTICKSYTPWFTKEYSWRTMQDNRLSTNPVKKFSAYFNYNDDYSVNMKTLISFQNQGLGAEMTMDNQFDSSDKFSLRFEVEFSNVEKISETVKPIE